jgi:hypothetical protein
MGSSDQERKCPECGGQMQVGFVLDQQGDGPSTAADGLKALRIAPGFSESRWVAERDFRWTRFDATNAGSLSITQFEPA